MSLSDKTAIVFGASQGIGLATANALLAQGANVVLASRRLSVLQDIVASMPDNHRAFAHNCDTAQYQEVENTVAFAMNITGRVDIVVNNAAVIDPLSPLHSSDPELWQQAINVNVTGVYHAMRAAAPKMIAQGGGTIVNLSSGAANSALVGWSHYCASKAAVKKLTEVAHKELAQHQIKVIGLSPGTVATPMMAKIQAANINPVSQLDWQQHIPPEWVAQAIVYLCGPEGKAHAGSDFSLKTQAGREAVGLPLTGVTD